MRFLCFPSRPPTPRTCMYEHPPPRMPKPFKRSGRGGRRLKLLEGSKGASLIAGSQPKSRLMNLPREVRDLIWEESVGGSLIYLTIDAQNYWNSYLRQANPADNRGLLSMPLCCRQGYVETIKVLYSKSTFNVSGVEALLSLPLVLIPQHAGSIRDLDYYDRFEHEPPEADTPKHKQWALIWKTLASFTGLKRLRVKIVTRELQGYQWQLEEARLLEYVKRVVQPQDFELVLTWPPSGQLPEIPCRILRERSDIL